MAKTKPEIWRSNAQWNGIPRGILQAQLKDAANIVERLEKDYENLRLYAEDTSNTNKDLIEENQRLTQRIAELEEKLEETLVMLAKLKIRGVE